MSDCPECGVINYGINPRCASCVRKVMLERISLLEAHVTTDNSAVIATLEARIALLEAAEKHNEILQESNRVAHDRIALLEAEVKEARKQGLEDGYMRANIENVGAYTLLKEENQRLRRALQHVQFYALDNVPDELREMAKAVLQEQGE